MSLNENIKLLQGDCLKLMKKLEDASIDALITDPPYQYLKEYISEVKRILKPTGFVIMFGRGPAFYRQGMLLADAGFKFKEEICWNKKKPSSPCLPLKRKHENCFIFAKTKKGTIRKCKIPFVEHLESLPLKQAIDIIKNTIRKIDSDIKKPDLFKSIMLYLEKNIIAYNCSLKNNFCITNRMKKRCIYSISALQMIKDGYCESDIMNISDMIEVPSLKNIHHPTEKPVRLMERLITLVSDEGDVILDSFMGSGSTGVACLNTKRLFIGMELDDTFFNIACQRIKKAEGKNKEELFTKNETGVI